MEVPDAKDNNLLLLSQFEGNCPCCEFRLKSPTTDKCPECGFTLRIVLAEPFRLSAWLLMLIGITASIVIALNFLSLRVAGWYFSNSGKLGISFAPWLHIVALILLTFVLIIIYFYWISQRRRIASQSATVRVFIGFSGVALPFGILHAIVWGIYSL